METASPHGGPPPHAIVMQMVMGAWTSQTIGAITRLGIPDLLQKHGPLTARQLTEDHGVEAKPELLQRALRACASLGVFTEAAGGRFGPTPLSDVLTLGSPTSVKSFVELIGGRWWKLFAALPEALRTGENQAEALRAQEPPAPPDARRLEAFGQAMKSRVDSTRGVVERYDFSRTQNVVDVGGGFGHLTLAILQRHPHVRGVVLDRPEVVAIAERYAADEDRAVRDRLSFVGGDMFVDVPPGDLYVLKAIIHDWDDASCLRVLQNCQARMSDDGRILCVDNVLPPIGDTGCSSTKLLDMLMMLIGGRERTEAEWRSLYDEAGLRVTSITLVNPRSGESFIEGVKR